MDPGIFDDISINAETLKFLKDILIVLGIGLLLGLEREYSKGSDRDIEIFAGVRTLPLVSVMGYLALYLGFKISIWIYVSAFVIVSLFSLLTYYSGMRKQEEGATTEFAIIVAFLLSALVYFQEYIISVFLTLSITALLALKMKIHKAVKALTRRDILSILLFMVITALILPMLPDRDFGPYGVLNPYKIWLIITIFISINFIAYFLHKFIGSKYSIITTGILGGFFSSTATAWYFSRLGGRSEKGGITHIAAILLSSSIMFPRLLIWLVFFSPELFSSLWMPVMIFGLTGFTMGYFLSKKGLKETDYDEPKVSNPINLKDAFFFAFIYVAILIMVAYAEENFGSRGVYIAAGISGLTDVDAITISMASYAQEADKVLIAAIAVLIAAFSNTFVKFVICMIFGNSTIRRYSLYTFIPLFVAGLAYIIYLIL